MTRVPSPDSYAFNNRAAEAHQQLAALESYLDPISTSLLDQVGVLPGSRCLEVGPGGGSIARWLAERTGPGGRVLACDLDTSPLAERALPGNVEVSRYDVREGLPDPGPYNIIHARLVLLHIPARRQVLATLVEALAPGGWLVIGEFSRQPLSVITAPSAEDAMLFRKGIDALANVLQQHGADLEWAFQLHPAMLDAGLRQVHTIEHAESWTGGGPGAQLHLVNSLQKERELLAAGLSVEELARFRELVNDPKFCARSWQFVCTRGRRP